MYIEKCLEYLTHKKEYFILHNEKNLVLLGRGCSIGPQNQRLRLKRGGFTSRIQKSFFKLGYENGCTLWWGVTDRGLPKSNCTKRNPTTPRAYSMACTLDNFTYCQLSIYRHILLSENSRIIKIRIHPRERRAGELWIVHREGTGYFAFFL